MTDRENRPTILFLTSVFAPMVGGAGAVAEALAGQLSQHMIVVATRSQSRGQVISDWSGFDRQFPFRCLRVSAFAQKMTFGLPRALRGPAQFSFNLFWTRPLAILSLVRQLGAAPVDVVCVNSLVDCYWIPPLLKLFRPALKIVYYLHGEEVGESVRLPRINQLAQQQMRVADAVVTVSRFTRERAIRCGADAARVTVISNGVDLARFSPGPRDEALRTRLHLEGRKVLLCLARLDERKGQDMLIDAMPAILHAVPDTVLLVAGSGSESEQVRLKGRATALGLGEAVRFVGSVPDTEVKAFYRTADVYIMPNRTTDSGDTEGFGLVFLEAGACRKPVIGGRAGGVPDAIVTEPPERQTGLLVDGRSPDEIAQACITLLQDEELASRLGENGLAHARSNSWERKAECLLELCRALEA